jgi:glycosyltransferase involved in cell wall biosynthesis
VVEHAVEPHSLVVAEPGADVEPAVSVVIPTRNRRRLLARALASALGQRGVAVDVIVVDDASGDGTARELASQPPGPVTVIGNAEPVGVSRARNAGLAAARGAWVAFLDDDDVWAPDRLRAQLDELERRPDARWACVASVVVDASLRIIGAQHPPRAEELPGSILRYNAVPGGASGVLVRTALVRELGGFDPELRILADWDLWIRLALRSPLATVDRPLVAYVLHGANMTAIPTGFADELERIRASYADARAEHGVELNEAGWSNWFAELERRGGRRLGPALGLARRAVVERRPELVLKGASMALRPGWVERRNRFRREALAPAWRREAEEWLREVQAAGDAAPEST